MLCVGWRNLFSSCAVVSVFGSGEKQVLVVHTTMYLEYHTVVVLCFFFGKKKDTVICLAGARSLLRPDKKKSSRLSGGCAIVITTGKKSSSRLSGGCAIVITTRKKKVLVMVRDRYYDRNKKVLVICLAGARLLLFLPRVRFTQNHPIFTRN